MNCKLKQWSCHVNALHRTGNTRKFWNLIKNSKRKTSPCDDIDIDVLHQYFQEKFKQDDSGICDSTVRQQAQKVVDEKYEQLASTVCKDQVISTSMVRQYISKLH